MKNRVLACKEYVEVRQKPDVARDGHAEFPSKIDKVGMESVEIPVRILIGESDPVLLVAKMDVFVDVVQPAVKGIHMSRLYSLLQSYFEDNYFSLDAIAPLMEALRDSQGDVATGSYLSIHFDYPVKRDALVSGLKGWRYYPVSYHFSFSDKGLKTKLAFSLTYSSTCPCSAALSSQLQGEKFNSEFGSRAKVDTRVVSAWLMDSKNMGGAPHAQRSQADISIDFLPDAAHHLDQMIEQIESDLKTPVQSAVKRDDEQMFAQLNAENFMFVEDAIRLIKRSLLHFSGIASYSISARHFESLHPHDAVAHLKSSKTKS